MNVHPKMDQSGIPEAQEVSSSLKTAALPLGSPLTTAVGSIPTIDKEHSQAPQYPVPGTCYFSVAAIVFTLLFALSGLIGSITLTRSPPIVLDLSVNTVVTQPIDSCRVGEDEECANLNTQCLGFQGTQLVALFSFKPRFTSYYLFSTDYEQTSCRGTFLNVDNTTCNASYREKVTLLTLLEGGRSYNVYAGGVNGVCDKGRVAVGVRQN